ncbi:PAQR family membrane homeostasis protein TrhA [Petrotoga olearia]|uniref:Hemolysin D n=2 Tax=Petrotoga olearia TaxID=156203 RepID=A0A2K1P144_9BACT|nr:hemolysin III family protein [Petrotoga olearia]PNR96457.1 hemolysin D [Petrotoga olearia DSM 13574]RMA76468.1 channel protein (hemolysin III family) [Petrotoga olearia]
MKDLDNIEKFTTGEEIANAVIHGIGALLSIAALVLLVVFSAINGQPWSIFSSAIYGSSLIILYLSSTLYHSFQRKKIKDLFEIFDHSAIYILIAGTYTPFALVTLNGSLGWIIFFVVWVLAAIGIIFKIFFVKRFRILSTILYIAMGWLVVFAMEPLVSNLDFWGLFWLVIGGILYTVGTIFYVWRKIPYHHALWHLIVLAGSICHFFSVFFYVI